MNRIKTGKWEFTEQELARQLRDAAKRGQEAERTEARADRVYYDGNHRRLIIELVGGVLLGIPVSKIQGLANAAPSVIDDVRLEPSGDAVRWDSLDLDFGIPGLVARVLGTNAWMAELGRKGGSVQSEAKAVAARANGLRGGRPAMTRTVTVTSAYYALGNGIISRPKPASRAYYTSAYWGRYEKLVDAYHTLRRSSHFTLRKNAVLGCSVPQKEAFGHLSGNVNVYHVPAMTEARTNADLALAA